jgi:hypothetical protein
MISIIDDVLQPVIQGIFCISFLIIIIIMKYSQVIKGNVILEWCDKHKTILFMIVGAGIYHYLIIPILFVHEFNGYEGFDYRELLKNNLGEPVNNFILFRKDKHSPLEAITLLVNKIKKYENTSSENILKNTLKLKNEERIKILASKIDEL